MAYETTTIIVISILVLLCRYLNQTDVPKIKGLPEVPGVPIFGDLIQLGSNHAKVTAKWAQKYGPVFQVRMGNKVSVLLEITWIKRRTFFNPGIRESSS